MVKKLLIIVALSGCQTFAADSSNGTVVRTYPGLTFEQAKQLFNKSMQDYSQCDCASNSALKIFDESRRQWQITAARPLSRRAQMSKDAAFFRVDLESTGWPSYFRKQKATNAAHSHVYRVSDFNTNKDELYKDPVLKMFCFLSNVTITEQSLTLLSKSLIASALVGTTVGAVYAYRYFTKSAQIQEKLADQKLIAPINDAASATAESVETNEDKNSEQISKLK